jgi:N-acetylglucosaminyl-diphospho-decaprenol L-rhamnosyltransferase
MHHAGSPRTTAVVTVAYHSDGVLPAFLASVGDAAHERPLVVVADNDPTDGSTRTREIVEDAGAGYLPLEGNAGYGAAVNAAVATLPGEVEWVLISNPDVVLGPGSLDELVRLGRERGDSASVGPRVLDANGVVYPSARAVPGLRSGIGHALLGDIWSTNPWSRRYRQENQPGDEPRDAGWLSGSCLLVRRDRFAEIGGFDESYFMYFEDVDLGDRFGRHGWANVYDPAAQVMHIGAHATRSESATMIRAHHASAARFLNRRYAAWYLWPLRLGLRAALAVRASLASRRSRRQSAGSNDSR